MLPPVLVWGICNKQNPKKTPEERQASLQVEDPLPANKLDDQPTEKKMLIIFDIYPISKSLNLIQV